MESDLNVSERETARKRVDRLVIDTLAESEAELRERITDLEGDNRWLRDLLHEAVAMLHRSTVQLDRSKGIVVQLHAELRDLRANGVGQTEHAA